MLLFLLISFLKTIHESVPGWYLPKSMKSSYSNKIYVNNEKTDSSNHPGWCILQRAGGLFCRHILIWYKSIRQGKQKKNKKIRLLSWLLSWMLLYTPFLCSKLIISSMSRQVLNCKMQQWYDYTRTCLTYQSLQQLTWLKLLVWIFIVFCWLM